MTSIDICNLALLKCGIPAITSFDDPNNNARMCRTFYPVLRDRVLRDHVWSFATTSYKLQQLDEESFDPVLPVVCGLPGDVIRVIELVGDRPYRMAEGKIFVRELPATVVYVRRVEDPGMFDDLFAEALQYLLASEIGLANTRDAQLVQFFRQEYERRLALARSIDSGENRYSMQNGPQRSSWLEAHFRAGGCDRGFTGPIKWTEGNAGKQGEL